jgi:homospermidine synthase
MWQTQTQHRVHLGDGQKTTTGPTGPLFVDKKAKKHTNSRQAQLFFMYFGGWHTKVRAWNPQTGEALNARPRRMMENHPDFVPFRPKKGVFASANTCAQELISIDLAQENVLEND